MKILRVTVLVAALALGACQNVKEELGVGRNSPDEFTVVKRAPLTLPPEYGLRPPADGSAPPAQMASTRAKTILLGQQQSVAKGSADTLLLDKMQVENASPNIRDTLDMENGYLALKNKPLVDKLMFWEDSDPAALDKRIPTSVVNPGKESERLKENAQEGKPVNEGDVPVIEKKKGTIDKIF